MIRTGVTKSAPRHAQHERHRAAPAIANLRGVVDELIEAGGDEVVELNLADRTHSFERGSDANADRRPFRKNCVDHALAVIAQQRLEKKKRVAILAANVFAVNEHAFIRAQRIADAEHHRFEKRFSFRIERRRVFDFVWTRHSCLGDRRPARQECLAHTLSRREHAFVRERGIGPRRIDHRLRFAFHQLLGLALERLDVDTELRCVCRDRIARAPEFVQLAICVAAFAERRILPRRLRIFAEVEHVVVMSVSAHAHRHELDECWTATFAGAFGRPSECRGDRFGIGAVNRDGRNSVAASFLREDAHGRLFADRRRQRRLIVLHAEDRGEFACGAGVDRFVPFAERRRSFADERNGHAIFSAQCERHGDSGDRQRRTAERRHRGKNAVRVIADVQVFAIHRRSRFSHLRVEHHANRFGRVVHGDDGAEVADHR